VSQEHNGDQDTDPPAPLASDPPWPVRSPEGRALYEAIQRVGSHCLDLAEKLGEMLRLQVETKGDVKRNRAAIEEVRKDLRAIKEKIAPGGEVEQQVAARAKEASAHDLAEFTKAVKEGLTPVHAFAPMTVSQVEEVVETKIELTAKLEKGAQAEAQLAKISALEADKKRLLEEKSRDRRNAIYGAIGLLVATVIGAVLMDAYAQARHAKGVEEGKAAAPTVTVTVAAPPIEFPPPLPALSASSTPTRPRR
jgi:hypothetical protein